MSFRNAENKALLKAAGEFATRSPTAAARAIAAAKRGDLDGAKRVILNERSGRAPVRDGARLKPEVSR